MAKKVIKDIDFAVVTARIRAKETKLLTHTRMEQLIEARSQEEVDRILQDCGYPSLDGGDPAEMNRKLAEVRKHLVKDLSPIPDFRYFEVFQLKYDYHNVKALLKAEAMAVDPETLLLDMGRVPVEELRRAMQQDELTPLPDLLAEAIVEAKEVMSTTRDPQLCDIALDRRMYQEMISVAEEAESPFLLGYVQAEIDSANLRSVVRTLRMGKNAAFLQTILFEGGEISMDTILERAGSRTAFADPYVSTRLQAAAESGKKALETGNLTEFEKLCDDAVTEYAAQALLISFGDPILVGYLVARDTEIVNLRILMLGRHANLNPDVIRSRLRASYEL